MTTPEDPVIIPRATRPDLDRDGPDRTGQKANPPPREDECVDKPPGDLPIDDVVANAVRSSYDTLAQTIAQGREAADRFRQGQYNMRHVPQDIEALLRRLLELARQLSGTTFDVCEQLLQQMKAANNLPEPGATKVPPFRRHGTLQDDPVPPGPAPAPAPATLPLVVRVVGTGKGTSTNSPTVSLARPATETSPDDLSAKALAPHEGDAKPIDEVEFAFDVSVMGLVATITVPADQPPGTYVGYVVSKRQVEPLGLLVVTIE